MCISHKKFALAVCAALGVAMPGITQQPRYSGGAQSIIMRTANVRCWLEADLEC